MSGLISETKMILNEETKVPLTALPVQACDLGRECSGVLGCGVTGVGRGALDEGSTSAGWHRVKVRTEATFNNLQVQSGSRQ